MEKALQGERSLNRGCKRRRRLPGVSCSTTVTWMVSTVTRERRVCSTCWSHYPNTKVLILYLDMCMCAWCKIYTHPCVLPVTQLYVFAAIFSWLWLSELFFLGRLYQSYLYFSPSVAASLFHLFLYPCSSLSPYASYLFVSFSSSHWGHWKTLASVPSPQEAQRLRVDWSLDFTTGSQNGDCSRSFSFPLRPLWIKDSWLLLQ